MSLFPYQLSAVDELRKERLIVAGQSFLSGFDPPDDYLYRKLLAAEKSAEHDLRVFFEPTEVLTDPTQAEIDGLGDIRWVSEPGYDFDPDMFRGESWGYLVTRQKPIIKVTSMAFSYPNPSLTAFTVPIDWVRLDKKYGHIRLVPSGNPVQMPLNAWIMSVLGGGRVIPHMIRLRYTAGLKDARNDYPDLVDLIKRIAVLGVMDDVFIPQSGSISADGLSESFSMDLDKYRDATKAKLEALRQQIHGIRVAFL